MKDSYAPELIIILCPPHWTKVPPMGPVFLKSYLNKYKVRTRIIDLNIYLYNEMKTFQDKWLKRNTIFEKGLFNKCKNQLRKFINYINKSKAGYIGFSCFDRNIFFTYDMIKNIHNKKIIVGGPQLLREQLSEIPADFIVLGEGETASYKILNKSSDSQFNYEELANLDKIPFYDFEDINLADYGNRIIPLYSSRGCIRKCRFCSEKLLYKKIRRHSPEYMFGQIESLIKKYNINHFVFHDSAINTDIEWLIKFCEGIIKRDINIKWEAQCIIRKEMSSSIFSIMKKAGCYNMFTGLESGSDKILKLMNKGFNTETANYFFNEADKADLHFEISLILDFPGETDKTVKETLDFIKSNKKVIPKIAQVNPYIPDIVMDMNMDIQKKRTDNGRLKKIIQFFKDNKIKYTKAFIGNLVNRY